MPHRKNDIAISELKIGEPADHEVLDLSGIVLLRKGELLTQEMVDSWTKRGFVRVYMRPPDSGDSSDDSEESRLTQPYDPVLLKELNACFVMAKKAVDEILFQLAMKEEPSLSDLEPVFQTSLRALGTDMGLVVANAASQKIPVGKLSNNSLATRSLKLSVLGAATAVCLGLSRDDCQAVATAGMLHDMSLFEETLAMLLNEYTSQEERREVLFRHALHSAELFSRCTGVSELVRIVITQVHEQVDGSGFPRGLPGHHLSTPARILNIVDAYLTLIESNYSQVAYVPSDAIAYLMYHTGQGVFDFDCMRAFLTALSIYSVGSKVELDDSTIATVLRSSKTDPLRPIVRLDDGSESIIDMRKSHLNISCPVQEPDFPHRQRLPRSQLQAILWKPVF